MILDDVNLSLIFSTLLMQNGYNFYLKDRMCCLHSLFITDELFS